MKHNARPVTFSLLVDAIRHRWKTILLAVALFALIGVGSAFLFADQGAASADGGAEALSPVSLSAENLRDRNRAVQSLTEDYQTALRYLSALSDEPSLQDPQQKELLSLQARLEEYQSTVLDPLISRFTAYSVFLTTADTLDERMEALPVEIAALENELPELQAAFEMIQSIHLAEASAYETSLHNESPDLVFPSSIDELYLRALRYPQACRELAEKKAALSLYAEDPSYVTELISTFDAELASAIQSFDLLAQEISICADTICLENHLLLEFVPDSKIDRAPMVKHTHTEAPRSEAFAIIVLFTALVGLCSGSFLAVCMEARKSDPQETLPSAGVSE